MDWSYGDRRENRIAYTGVWTPQVSGTDVGYVIQWAWDAKFYVRPANTSHVTLDWGEAQPMPKHTTLLGPFDTLEEAKATYILASEEP